MHPVKISQFASFCCLILVSLQVKAQVKQNFQNVDTAIARVRQTYHVSVGLEIVLSETSVRGPLSIDLTAKDPASVFNAITAQQPIYAWTLEDKFYDIYPSQTDSLSELIIGTFVLTNATLSEIKSSVFDLPEVKEWLFQHHAVRTGLIARSTLEPPRGAPRQEPKRISLTLSNVPLRTILNRVSAEFDTDRWVVGHVPAKGDYAEYVSISF